MTQATASRAATATRRTRRVLLLAALSLLAGLVAWRSLRAPSIRHETVVLARGDLEDSVTALGSLQPHDYVDVGAQASGQIQRLHITPGSVVKKGDLLAEIDPRLQQAAVDASRAALAELNALLAEQQAQVELTRHQHRRREILVASGAVNEEELQTHLAALRAAEARVASIEARLAQARSTLSANEAELGYTRIYAPMDGTVVSVDAREGQTLNASQQAPVILRIADLSTMTVWSEVSEADVIAVEPGMPVYFNTLGSNRRWHSTVRQILPAPVSAPGSTAGSAAPGNGKVVLYTVLFDIENTDGQLLPQMTAQVFFVTASAKDAIIAPLAALTKQDDGAYAARVLDATGLVERRTVRLGARDRLRAEVLSGLTEGDRLIVAEIAPEPRHRLFRW